MQLQVNLSSSIKPTVITKIPNYRLCLTLVKSLPSRTHFKYDFTQNITLPSLPRRITHFIPNIPQSPIIPVYIGRRVFVPSRTMYLTDGNLSDPITKKMDEHAIANKVHLLHLCVARFYSY